MSRPQPQPTVLSQPFWDACRRGELTYMACNRCGARFFPPAPACISCLSVDVGWRPSAGQGRVYSFTVMHRAPFPGFDVPAILAIVELDEGYSMITSLVECQAREVAVGDDVEVVFERQGDDIDLPLFRPRRRPGS
jgi:uncharacterized OB-fold protein